MTPTTDGRQSDPTSRIDRHRAVSPGDAGVERSAHLHTTTARVAPGGSS